MQNPTIWLVELNDEPQGMAEETKVFAELMPGLTNVHRDGGLGTVSVISAEGVRLTRV